MQPLTQGGQVIRELFETIEAHARGMWRYRWHTIVMTWIFGVAVWAFVYTMPPVYEAQARVFVDTENAIRPLLRDIATASDLMSEVAVVTREMLSRPILAEVARDTNLDALAQTDEDFERLLVLMRKRIKIDGDNYNMFTISFEHTERTKAIAVVDSLLNIFIEKSLGSDRTESNTAQAFLRNEIGEYEARLTESESRLAQFKRDNVALMPDKRGDYFSRLQSAESVRITTQSRLRLAEERRTEMMRQLDGEEPVFGLMPSTVPEASGSGATAGQIARLQTQLSELRLQYTDKHPRIGQILETIQQLQEQQAIEFAQSAADRGNGATMSPNPLDLNPVYQNMRLQLSNTDVEIASLRVELSQQQAQVAELRTLVDTVPQVEADLSRLNRDYDVVKSKYAQLLAQLERARIGENVEKSIDDVKFRVVDPPFVGQNPVGPKRHPLLAAGTILAVGLGVALAFLLNQLHPVFYSSRSVTLTNGVPVLGVVSLLVSPEESRSKKRGHLIIAAATTVFVLSFFMIYQFAERLSQIVRDIA